MSSNDKAILQELRQRIDAVDDEILALIQQRASLATQVGEHKHGQGDAPFYVPSREAKIIRRLLEKNAAHAGEAHVRKIPDEAIHGIYREIIGACLSLEHPMTIAYLGPDGTYSHAAATRQFGSSAGYLACKNIEAVFDAVEAGRATYGVVPVENAFEGAVTHTLDLFADHERDVYICAEVMLSIHAHLFSYAKKLEDIRLVLSHPQPLAQCKHWLQQNLPTAELQEVASTVAAVKKIIEASSDASAAKMSGIDPKHAAAIGPYSILEQTEMPILQKNIEDHHDNTTRFLVIGSHDALPSGEDKTSVVMSVRDKPGALQSLLSHFSSRGIGLSRIESRPSKKKLWEYVFFADLLGHRDDAQVAEALAEIGAMPDAFLKVLGSYPVSRSL